MCNIHISLRVHHTESLIKAKPGVYFTHEELRDYWNEQTGILVALSHVPGVLNRIQANGLTTIHRRGDTVSFETEALRTVRLEYEAAIKTSKLRAQAEKDALLWAKKRQKVQDLLKELEAAQSDLKAFEDSRQDSILRVA